MRASQSLAVAALAASASALATPRAVKADVNINVEAGTEAAAGGPNDTAPFILKTQTIHGSGSKFDGLYVYAYHTGAGLNDAMLDPNQSVANVGSEYTGDISGWSPYFSVIFDLANYPYQLLPALSPTPTPYPGLLPVRINVGRAVPTADNAFYFEKGTNNLRWTNAANSKPPGGFAGWLACQSQDHGSLEDPNVQGIQLFYRPSPGDTPSGCAEINLVARF